MIDQTKETVGFVGVGLMGHGIAGNILEAGYPLKIVGHRNRAPIDDLVSRGAVEAGSLVDLAGSATIIFLCLTDAGVVRSVVEEMGPALAAGTVIVDCSTSDPSVTLALAEELKSKGVAFCDAPLGGTPAQAEAGRLQAMVGASDDTFARLEPIFDCWAERAVHVGNVGDGHRMKLINNFISLGYGALFSEAIAIARKSGLSVEQFDSVIRGGRMDCGFYQTFMGYALEGNRDAHKFTLKNAYKDMRYVEAMANGTGSVSAISSAVKNSYATAIASGCDGPEDFVPHLVDVIGRINGVG